LPHLLNHAEESVELTVEVDLGVEGQRRHNALVTHHLQITNMHSRQTGAMRVTQTPRQRAAHHNALIICTHEKAVMKVTFLQAGLYRGPFREIYVEGQRRHNSLDMHHLQPKSQAGQTSE
jgi:hypothetical protein